MVILEFLINLIIAGLFSIFFFGISFIVLLYLVKRITKAVFLVSCVISLILTIILFSGDASFFTLLLGALCGLVICYLFLIGKIDICSNCGAWNEYELVEERNKKTHREDNLVRKSKAIYNKNHEFVGTIEEGYEWEKTTVVKYDAVYRCRKCGNEIIVHK
ncbi:MAG: hypothetical protein IIW93_08520 [Bacteroidaceae bacterium]|nr:hypothetical protein [Bacteroidaceae bacterium]